jgi:hypothetical protein
VPASISRKRRDNEFEVVPPIFKDNHWSNMRAWSVGESGIFCDELRCVERAVAQWNLRMRQSFLLTTDCHFVFWATSDRLGTLGHTLDSFAGYNLRAQTKTYAASGGINPCMLLRIVDGTLNF